MNTLKTNGKIIHISKKNYSSKKIENMKNQMEISELNTITDM